VNGTAGWFTHKETTKQPAACHCKVQALYQQDVHIDTLKGNLDLWRSSHCDLIPTKHTSVSLRSLATTTQRRICYWDSNNIQSRVMS